MVDAITSYKANKPSNPKADLSINWNKLTVKEIKKYEGEGQEIPEYIKKWAYYMDKLQSVPDNVTYETYSGVKSLDDNTDYAGLNNGLNPSASTQAEVYQKMCKDTVNSIKNVTQQLNEIMKNAEKEVKEAEKTKEGICDRIQTFQQRIQKLKDDKKDQLAAMEIPEINRQIKAAGESGVLTMDMRLVSLQNIGADVSDAYDLIRGATSLANTATSLNSDVGRYSFIKLKYSKELKKLAQEKKKDLESANKQQETNLTTVEGYKSEVGNKAGQFIPPGAAEVNQNNANGNPNSANGQETTAKADEKASANKSKIAKSNAKSQEEKKKSLANEKILTDPNEILKRKQKRGEA